MKRFFCFLFAFRCVWLQRREEILAIWRLLEFGATGLLKVLFLFPFGQLRHPENNGIKVLKGEYES